MNIYELIDKKVIDYAEIVVCLFDYCNMTCAFCSQNHNDTRGASREEIMSKVPGIVNWINKNTRSSYFKIHIMGGELFQDELINKGFLDIYQEFIDSIRDQVDPKKEVVPNFVTNLVFDEVDKVKDFLVKNNLKVSISYDPRGRFKGKQLEVFKRNVEYFKPQIEMVSLVMTKQNIAAVVAGDEYFDYLYSTFITDWDSLIPSVDIGEKMMPKESEVLQLYKLLVDKYPECLNMKYFTEDTPNRMSCTRGNSYTVLFDGSNPVGCSGSVMLRDPSTNVKDLGSPIILQKFFDSYDCFSCEYFSRCSFTCFIKNDYSKIVRDVGECVFKEVYRYVESKKTENNIP